MRIAYLGTPEFAVPGLKMLIEEGYDIAGVFCQPDRKSGRGHKVSFSPVKEIAVQHGIAVYQFEKIKSQEGMRTLEALNIDLMITAAFGQILSKEILDIPPRGCINVHASLLPKYRGAAPIQWAIINGETETGITTMLTDVGLDTGDILKKKKTAIGESETGGQLYQRLSVMGAEVLKETLAALREDRLHPQKQDEANASYYPILTKDMAKLNFNSNAKALIDRVRALDPVMGCFAMYNGETIKMFGLKKADILNTGKPGEILMADAKEGLVVMAGDVPVVIGEIQMPGGRRMDARDFLRGRPLQRGVCFE